MKTELPFAIEAGANLLFAIPCLIVFHPFVEGTRQWVGGYAANLAHAIVIGPAFFFAPFCVRTLLKRDWPAALAASVVGIWVEGGLVGSEHWQIMMPVYLAIYFGLFLVMLRFGLLAVISTLFF